MTSSLTIFMAKLGDSVMSILAMLTNLAIMACLNMANNVLDIGLYANIRKYGDHL